jgi:hypothetical protein
LHMVPRTQDQEESRSKTKAVSGVRRNVRVPFGSRARGSLGGDAANSDAHWFKLIHVS